MSGRFLTALMIVVERTEDVRAARLFKPLVFAGSRHTITVPAGYRSDLASVPWFARWLMPSFEGETASASVIHDYLYDTHQIERADADAVFFDALIASHAPRWQAWAMFWAVRLFGGSGWERDHREYLARLKGAFA